MVELTHEEAAGKATIGTHDLRIEVGIDELLHRVDEVVFLAGVAGDEFTRFGGIGQGDFAFHADLAQFVFPLAGGDDLAFELGGACGEPAVALGG